MAMTLLIVIGGITGGGQALLGIALGVSLSVFNLYSLWRLTSSLLKFKPEPKEGVQRTLLVGILKFPLFIVFIFFGTRLSGAGIGCFILSIGMVYFALIGFRSFSDA